MYCVEYEMVFCAQIMDLLIFLLSLLVAYIFIYVLKKGFSNDSIKFNIYVLAHIPLTNFYNDKIKGQKII